MGFFGIFGISSNFEFGINDFVSIWLVEIHQDDEDEEGGEETEQMVALDKGIIQKKGGHGNVAIFQLMILVIHRLRINLIAIAVGRCSGSIAPHPSA